MFLRKAALRPVPRHAVVDEHFVQLVEAQLDAHEDDLLAAIRVAQASRVTAPEAPLRHVELAGGGCAGHLVGRGGGSPGWKESTGNTPVNPTGNSCPRA